jgi:hypothetical protein
LLRLRILYLSSPQKGRNQPHAKCLAAITAKVDA